MTVDAVEVDESLLRRWPLPDATADGEDQGRVLVVAGSRQTPGAALLCSEAALRAGARKVQVLTVGSVATTLAVAVPELLVEGADETDDGELTPAAAGQARDMAKENDVVLVGPGFMSPSAAADFCRALLPPLTSRVVVDALCLAYFADEPEGPVADGRAILTPNSGEVALALGVEEVALQTDRDRGASRLAYRHRAVVTTGGSCTWVASPDGRLWRDTAGHPGLAASGSGDTKAGIIAALYSRTEDAARAAVWGGHLHALAGERLGERLGAVGYLAREVASEVPAVLSRLQS
jgi:hydroxyethylthiazole kinase-like uncharacterized protein yjeF